MSNRVQAYLLYWWNNGGSTWATTEHVPVRVYLDEQRAMKAAEKNNKDDEARMINRRYGVKSVELDDWVG